MSTRLGLFVLLLGVACTEAKTAATPPITSGTISGVASASAPVSSPALQCPPVDPAELAAEEAEEQERASAKGPAKKLLLSEVVFVPARSPRAAPVAEYTLGDVLVGVPAPKRPPLDGIGLGFRSLDADLFKAKIAQALEAPLAAYEQRGNERMEAATLSNRLQLRANLLRAFPPERSERAACAEQDLATAKQAFLVSDKAWGQAAKELLARLVERPQRNAHERLLLAYLQLRFVPQSDEAARAKALQEFRALTSDPSLPPEDRAWAWQGVAELSHEPTAFVEAAKLTGDPAFRLDMLANVSELTPFEQREPKLRELIAAIDKSGLQQWRLPDALSDLSVIRKFEDDPSGARDLALRCVSLVEPSDADNVYRTMCSEVLAWALFELGVPSGVEVPLVTLGPLALALMDEAIGHFDREAARHVGELLLVRAPLAVEAPEVVERLKTLSNEPPTEPQAVAEELDLRASLTVEWCAHEFASTPKVPALSVRVDTTGPRPAIKVTPNGNKPFVRCLERQGALFFRGLGPSRIRFKLAGPPAP